MPDRADTDLGTAYCDSDDHEDLEALPPAHFLLGRASPTNPFIPMESIDLSCVFTVSQAVDLVQIENI